MKNIKKLLLHSLFITLFKMIFFVPIHITGGIGNISQRSYLPIFLINNLLNLDDNCVDCFSYDFNMLDYILNGICTFIIVFILLYIITLIMQKIGKLFIPKKYVKNIFDIDYKQLEDNGFKIIIFDLDNTLGNIKEEKCNKEIVELINKLSSKFIVIVASNSLKKRVLTFCSDLNCNLMYFCLKPFGLVLNKIKKKHNIDYEKMVIVGDQLLTDMFVGNRYKLLTILVDKKSDNDFKITKINRKMEKVIKKKYDIKEGEYY